MATPKTVGTAAGVASGLVMQPEVDWSLEEKVTAVIKYAGTYADCLAAVLVETPTYKRGQIVTIDGVTLMTLEKITLKKSPGNRGTISLVYSKQLPTDTLLDGEEPPRFECEWVEISRPIEQHPRYTLNKNLDGTDANLYAVIHPSGFAFIRAYFAADAEEQKAMWDPTADTGTIEEFGDHTGMKELITKKLRGQYDFILYSPVIRAVSAVNGIPAASNCGLRKAPPAEADAPANYQYLQTADRTIPNGTGGRYTRTLEFTGADWIDEDIYPAAPEELPAP